MKNCNHSEITESCYSVQANEKFSAVVQAEKKRAFLLLQLYNAAKAAKTPLLEQTEHKELSSFANMVAKNDINALKI